MDINTIPKILYETMQNFTYGYLEFHLTFCKFPLLNYTSSFAILASKVCSRPSSLATGYDIFKEERNETQPLASEDVKMSPSEKITDPILYPILYRTAVCRIVSCIF